MEKKGKQSAIPTTKLTVGNNNRLILPQIGNKFSFTCGFWLLYLIKKLKRTPGL